MVHGGATSPHPHTAASRPGRLQPSRLVRNRRALASRCAVRDQWAGVCQALVGRPRLAQKPSFRPPDGGADRLALLLGGGPQLGLEVEHPLPQVGVGRAPRIRTASRPALRALPTATVATGTPDGICTIESRESMPSRCLSGDRDADHRQRRDRGEHAGQVGRSPGAGDDHRAGRARRPRGRRRASRRASGGPRRRRPRRPRRTPRAPRRRPSSPASRSRSPSRCPTRGCRQPWSLTLVPQVAGEPRRRVAGALETVLAGRRRRR